MTSTAIQPEVVGLEDQTQVLESSPITAAEVQSRHRRMVKIKAAHLDKMEKDLLIGKELLEITRTKEYRGLAEGESGLTFDEWLNKESAQMMPDGRAMGDKTAAYLRGFYYFRNEVLPSGSSCSGEDSLPRPTAAAQVRPLLFLLDHLRRDTHRDDGRKTFEQRRAAEAKAIEIWKGAVSEAKGNVPTFDQVNRARLKDNAAAEQHRLRGSATSKPPQRPTPPSVPSAGSSEGIINAAAHTAANDVLNGQPTPGTEPPDFSPKSPSNSIPAWELETHDDSVDAGAECRRITHAMNAAFKAVAELRGILYSQTNKYGSDYLNFLRQVDAGVYSLHNIDDQIEQLGDDIDFIAELLTADVGEGELSKSTIDVNAVPSR
jgi:hypothetical protein